MKADASAIILHQYDVSPFSEKVRVVLGMKKLAWFACDQPVIMPKPDLLSLTGAYRKIPVMQIGADIYCDTQIIIRELERRFPSPSILVGGDRGIGYGIGFWTDRPLFLAVVAALFGGDWQADEAFIKDREQLMGRPFDIAGMREAAPHAAEQMRAQFGWVEEQLSDGRAFLMGAEPGLVDADVYHNIAFLRWGGPGATRIIDAFPRLRAWEERVKAIGHGERSEIGREEAIAVARAATSIAAPATDAGEPNGLKAGDRIMVMADDYGRDPVEGELVSSSAQHVAVRRTDPRAGEIVVHLPRAGFTIVRAR